MVILVKPRSIALLVSASLLFGGVALAQQAAPAPTYPDSVKAYVGAAKKQVKTIKLEEFRALVDQNAAGLVVDVREDDEYADGHVPGAINVPRGLIEFRIWKEVGFPAATDTARQITLYCASGGRAALATQSLQELGFTNVAAVDMKFEDWAKGGNPVVKPK